MNARKILSLILFFLFLIGGIYILSNYFQLGSIEEALDSYLELPWPIMAALLGFFDGFNPCAMWSLVVLIGFLLTMEDKKRRWLIGGVFLLSSGILYGAALFGYLLGFSKLSSLLTSIAMNWVFIIMGFVAIISAFGSFYAFWKNKVECEIRDMSERQKFHQKLSNILKKEELYMILPGVIVLAFSVNSIELLCSLGIPTAFTARLVDLGLPLSSQLTAIGIYDFFYMLDDLVVFLIAMFAFSITTFSNKMVRISHLAGGILLLILGLLMVFDSGLLTDLFNIF